jgi:hypothetical protein
VRRAPLLLPALSNARWSIDFVHDQFASGRRFGIVNVVDDLTKECLLAMADRVTPANEKVGVWSWAWPFG